MGDLVGGSISERLRGEIVLARRRFSILRYLTLQETSFLLDVGAGYEFTTGNSAYILTRNISKTYCEAHPQAHDSHA